MKSLRMQAGVAAVEFAIIVPVILAFLTVPFYFARYFMYYSVAQKSAQEAARYLSTVSKAEIRSTTLAPIAAATAKDILETTVAGLKLESKSIDIQCDGLTCYGGTIPTTVRVTVRFHLKNTLPFAWDTGDDGYLIHASSTMPYVGH